MMVWVCKYDAFRADDTWIMCQVVEIGKDGEGGMGGR